MTDHKEEGVFYVRQQYAGILRRLIIDAVDCVCVAVLVAIAVTVLMVLDVHPRTCLFVVFAIAYAYLGVLKATPLGTVGYLVAGVKLVNIAGDRASLWQATMRFLFLVVGPLNPVLDIIWLGGDRHRQSLRDKFAGTYMVRRTAQPAGRGNIEYKIYFFFGYALLFQEVTGVVPEETVALTTSTRLGLVSFIMSIAMAVVAVAGVVAGTLVDMAIMAESGEIGWGTMAAACVMLGAVVVEAIALGVGITALCREKRKLFGVLGVVCAGLTLAVIILFMLWAATCA